MRVLSVSSRYTEQPEQNIITISRVKDAECPYRYYKNYVEHPRQEPAFVSIEAGLGSFFHSYLDSHFRGIIARGGVIRASDVLDVSNLVAEFRLSFLWEGALRPPYKIVRGYQTIDEFISRLEQVGHHFNHALRHRLVGHRVLAVEGRLQIRTPSFYIRGKHDLITRTPKGELILWDWKTGRAPVPEYYRDYLNQKIQLGIYAVWMRDKYQQPSVKGTAVFLRDATDLLLTETFTPAVEQDVLSYLSNWRSKLNGLSSYPPIPSALCPWCGWNHVCPAHRRDRAPILALHDASIAVEAYSTERDIPSRCFIAGAVFANEASPEVGVLRDFRDEFLLRSSWGRALVRFYERSAPPVATWLRAHGRARRVMRWVIRGLVACIRAFNKAKERLLR